MGDKYKPSFIKDVQPSRVSGTNTQDVPLPELDGLTRQGWRDRENKIQQIIKDNYIGRRSAQPESSMPPLYRLQLPDERPIVDLGNMTLMEYNALSPQLRAALRDYYLPRPQQGEDSRPPHYKLQLPDEKPLVDLEGLSLREWMERENRIKEILKENYKPSFLENIKENESRNFIYPSGYNISNSVEAENMAKAMNLKIRRVNDINDLTQQEKKYLDDHSRGKGFYNPETNEVVVIDKNIESDVDFQNTFIQKGVGEKGLQSILGDDMDGFLDDVYNNMTHRESEKYSANGGSSREIALSYISDLVKNPSINPGEWQRLSAYVRNLFRNRYNVQNLSDETVQNLLWRTANQITGDDSIEEMIRKSAGLAILRNRDNFYLKDVIPESPFKHTRMQNIYKNIKRPIDFGNSANKAYLYKNIDYGNYKLLDAFDIEGNNDFIRILQKAINDGEIKTYFDYLRFLSNLYNK